MSMMRRFGSLTTTLLSRWGLPAWKATPFRMKDEASETHHDGIHLFLGRRVPIPPEPLRQLTLILQHATRRSSPC
jgi:hypothetical protein